MKSSCKRDQQQTYAIMYPANERIPKAKLCLMKMQPKKFLVFALLGLLALVVILVIILLYSKKDASCTPDLQFNPRNSQNINSTHSGCENSLQLTRACQPITKTSWVVHNQKSKDWKQMSSKVIPSYLRETTSTIVVSPLYQIQPSCAVQISLSLKSNISFQLFIVFEQGFNDSVPIKMTSDLCRYALIEDTALLSRLQLPFHLVLLTNSDFDASKNLYGSISSHACFSYQTIQEPAVVSSNPTFSVVKPGDINYCTFEFLNRQVKCEWMQVPSLSDDNFTRLENHDCIEIGALKGRSHSWFFFLTTERARSKSYLISPIINSQGDAVEVSLMFISQCSNTTLRYFTIASVFDIANIATGQQKPDKEIDLGTAFSWIDLSVKLSAPKPYLPFQVVVEVDLVPQSNCSEHYCFQGPRSNEFGTPLLGLDQIELMSAYRECPEPKTNRSNEVNCAFQNRFGSKNYCLWGSSLPPNIPPGVPDNFKEQFSHWKLTNRSNSIDTGHEALDHHFEGRGYIAEYSSYNTENYFGTVDLVSDRNCSCQINFWYLLRGLFAPRLQLSVIVEPNSTFTQPKFPQWSAFGEQNNGNWSFVNTMINLPDTRFRIEFNVIDIPDSRARAYIDDVSFHGCDFRPVG